MYTKEFSYSNSTTDKSPHVLVTSENQHIIRGFNANYMTKGQATRIQNEWRKIRNMRWSLATKERVVMKRVGSPARNSYRTYRKEFVR